MTGVTGVGNGVGKDTRRVGPRLEVLAVDGLGEVTAGTDLVALARSAVPLEDGDVVLLTSKVVSKAEGRLVRADRAAAVRDETVRVVARRGETVIAENHLGLVMAAAGVDASNVPLGQVVLLPRDPDGTARAVREGLRATTGRNVAVVVSDTAGRAWRQGQTDIAIGVAGLEPLASLAGEYDGHGNPLAVTAPAIGDELAGAADLLAGKLEGRPLVVVRGLGTRVLDPGEHGPGAVSLLRPSTQDMFGLGAREAVLAAVRGVQGAAFGAPAGQEELLRALAECGWHAGAAGADVSVEAAADQWELARVVAFAHGWVPAGTSDERMLLRRSAGAADGAVTAGHGGRRPGAGRPAP